MTRRASTAAAAVVAAAAAIVLLIAGRDTWFYLDEWDFSLRAAHLSADSIMNPNNQNWHGTVVLLYRALFELFGFGGYAGFRIVSVSLVVVIGVLGYLYARPRIGPWWALLPLGLLAASPAFEVQLWPFQIGQLLSGAAGLGALLLVDREPRRGSQIAAAALLVVAVASSSAGIPLVLVVVLDRLLTRGRRMEALVALPAILAYALWYLEYAGREPRPNQVSAAAFSAAADKAVEVADGNITALLGLTSQGPKGTLAGQVGFALLVVLVCWRLFGRYSAGRARVVALAGGLLAYWGFLAWGRPFNPGLGVSGRYVFLSQILLVLLLVELSPAAAAWLRDRRWNPSVRSAAAVAVVVVAGLALLHNARTELDFGGSLRDSATAMRGQVSALALLPPERLVSAPIYLEPLTSQIPRAAETYFATMERFGGLDLTEADVRALPAAGRARADLALMSLSQSELPARDAGTPPPTVSGSARAEGSCVIVRGTAELRPPPAGVGISNLGDRPLTLQARRYASDWSGPARAEVAPAASITLGFGRDRGTAAWRLRLTGGSARVCSLAATA